MTTTTTKKITVDDLGHRLRQTLDRKATRFVNNRTAQEVLAARLKPLQDKMRELKETEKELRGDLTKTMLKNNLQTARLHFDKALLEMSPPRLSVNVTDIDEVPTDLTRVITQAILPDILREWRAWEGTAEEFYEGVPGVEVMEGDYAVKVTI